MITWENPSRLDRVEDRRGDPAWVAGLWTSPSARVLPVTADGRISWADGDPGYRRTAGELTDQHLLAGLIDGAPVFVAIDDSEPGEGAGLVALRAVMDGLDETGLQLAFTAVALAGWHRRAQFCGGCGGATVAVRAGAGRVCSGCGTELYPRVDPAVIVAVTDADDRLLLGRQPIWPQGRVSVFAGFTEAGESLEQAVHREVFEEVGLRLGIPRYLGSQPWPFPRSMMVGFTARALDTELTLDSNEIESARWFTREELTAGLAAGEVALPMPTSIAFRMITAWRDRRLTAEPTTG